MNPTSPQVNLVKHIPASARRLFEAWLDPTALGIFMCAAPGMSVTRTEVDQRVGGEFLIVMKLGDQELPHRGKYLQLERYTKLSFTWCSQHAGELSHVVLQFEAKGPELTELRLLHYGLPPTEVGAHQGGWTHILECLDARFGPS